MSFVPLSRRHALLLAAAGSAGALLRPAFSAPNPGQPMEALAPLAALEQRSGGRLGVVLMQGERLAGRRAQERFALCSSFKLPLAALALQQAALGRLDFEEKLPYGESDLLGWAPIARERLAKGAMTVGEAAWAAQVHSDNTAANLLLPRLGGVAAYNAFLRELGDVVIRLDTMEPAVGMAAPDGVGNTTTPAAMADVVRALTLGSALPAKPRAQLLDWMRATVTGAGRLPKGIPAGWALGHKTGSQAESDLPNLTIDVGVAFPPARPPLVMAVYYEGPVAAAKIRPEDEAVVAEVGRIATLWAQT